MDDYPEQSDDLCIKCGELMVHMLCNDCGGDGHTEYGELHEQDPLWYDEDDVRTCDECRGLGHHVWCQQCGWDHLWQCYLNWPLVGPVRSFVSAVPSVVQNSLALRASAVRKE